MGVRISRSIYLREVIVGVIFILLLLKVLLYSTSDNGNLAVSKIGERSDVLKSEFVSERLTNQKQEISSILDGRDVFPLSPIENELLYRAPIDIALIFVKVTQNHVFQYHLKRTVKSILKNAKAPIRLHLIADEDSFSIGSAIIKDVQESNQWDTRHVKVVFVSAEDLATEVEPTVKILQDYFTNQKHSKYRDFLFFFSLFLDRLLPGLTNIILMDIDIQVNGDIAELHSHFSRFSKDQVMGLCPELSPVYRHILSTYRSQNPETTLGNSLISGGFPGYNSGVLLINIPRVRESSLIRSYLTREKLDEITKKYAFQGHLGDQDLYTLIALDHPDIFYTVPCNWNRQLCLFWKIKLYEDVFEDYFTCPGPAKILHGNCKSPIPEDKDDSFL